MQEPSCFTRSICRAVLKKPLFLGSPHEKSLTSRVGQEERLSFTRARFLPPPRREKFNPLTWEYCYPLPAGFVVLKCEIEFTSREEYCSPSSPTGFPPPLRHSTCSPSRRRKLRRSSIARLLLFPFRIYIRRGPLGEFPPPKMRD